MYHCLVVVIIEIGNFCYYIQLSCRFLFSSCIVFLLQKIELIIQFFKKQKAAIENSYKKQLEEKSEEVEAVRKNLTDLKAHYDKFSLLKDQEIETLSNTCEQAKRVIKELEETVASLRYEVKHLRDAKDKECGDLRKEINGMNGVNDTLRRTLNEKVEELNQVKENVSCVWCSASQTAFILLCFIVISLSILQEHSIWKKD